MVSPDQQLITAPKWRPEDLGAPLPDSAHANSVCLPRWQDIVDYEEKNPRVMSRLQAGYPRFVVPAICARFFEECRKRFGRDGELCHAYPSERAALRCASYIERWSGQSARVVSWDDRRVHIVCFPAPAEAAALKYWRHTGDGISSRRAESLLAGRPEAPSLEARRALVSRLAGLTGVPDESVYLFKSGMAAIYALHRSLARRRPDAACIQFGFPYVDTLKIQEEFGVRSTFFPLGTSSDIKMLNRMAAIDQIAGIFCEFPSNPLLQSPDLRSLSRLCRQHGIPLVVDDTIATCINVDLLDVADVLVTSLTKFFNGRGDIMAGSVMLNPRSPLHPELLAAFRVEYEETSWGDSLVLMEQNSRNFAERMHRINRTAEIVCDWLQQRPEVKHVYYPKYQTRELYDAFKRPGGGYSGLFSLVLMNPAETTIPFYDHLEFNKGPNLGTTFSLCCPFTLLAHYDELEWAEQCGVSRYLCGFPSVSRSRKN